MTAVLLFYTALLIAVIASEFCVYRLFILWKYCGACHIMRRQIGIYAVHCTGEAFAFFETLIAEIIYVLKCAYMGESSIIFKSYII